MKLSSIFSIMTLVAVVIALVMMGCTGSQSGGTQGEGSGSSTKVNIPKNCVRIELNSSLEGFVPDTIHLDRMRDGEVISSNFVLHNKSDEPIVIVGSEAACGCSQISYDAKPIMPDEERLVEFTFDSSRRIGYQLKYFDITLSIGGSIRVYFDTEVSRRERNR